ncbi:MAG: repressor LexA [Chlamydiales bacterium]|nr:repressor LexA [Chlamydiales bacterium]
MTGLTKRQREIVDFIKSHIAEKSCSPSYREIQNFFGFSSLGSVYNHIQTLKRKGVLSNSFKGARTLSLQKENLVRSLPIIGKLRGGFPIETFVQPLSAPFPSPFFAEECYLLVVEGDSLLEECLQEGDFVLVIPRSTFQDGEMVIALIEKETTLLKRAFSDPPYIRFESTNPQVQPLIVRADHVAIQGVILTVIRNF